jgi:translation initiation factor IF-2
VIVVISGKCGPISAVVKFIISNGQVCENAHASSSVKVSLSSCKVLSGNSWVPVENSGNVLAGGTFYVYQTPEELEKFTSLCIVSSENDESKDGITIVASSAGVLDAIVELLAQKKIDISYTNIGMVRKGDVLKTGRQKTEKTKIILAFGVSIEEDATIHAKSSGVAIFQSDIVYRSC